MNKPPAFQFYPKDWLSDAVVRSLTYEQKGWYIDLLAHCWLEGFVANDIEYIFERLLKVEHDEDNEEYKIAQLQALLKDCFVINESDKAKLYNKRLFLEREKQIAYHLERSRSGKKGAKLKYSNKLKTPSSAIAQHVAKPSFSSSSSFSSSKEKINPNEFLDKIKSNPAYKHIDIDKELSKMDAWILVNKGRKKTKGFVVNWLNKAADRAYPLTPVQKPTVSSDWKCFVCGKLVKEPDRRTHMQDHEKEVQTR